MSDNPLRSLPSIDRLINHLSAAMLIQQYSRSLTLDALRQSLDETRQQLLSGALKSAPSDSTLIDSTRATLETWLTPTLRPVINATGVIVHTNLGRAPLSDAAIDAIRAAASGYTTLEYDLESGKRGSRSVHAEALLQRITGAEAALVVNNNAAAVLLALTALAPNQSVIISRSQLVEIGGGFRMPDVMSQSGAVMREVGTTNRTHLADYQRAIDSTTAALLRVHRSNFAIIGFTTEPTLSELAELAHQHNLLLIDDLGSGALIDTAQFGLAPEPTIQASLDAPADLIMFSGDKLLGGPQCGILIGTSTVIDRLRHHPLTRALRPDKLCLAALSATLMHYLKGEALKCIPIWQMISQPLSAIEAQANDWSTQLTQSGLDCTVIDGQSAIGGGSLPTETLPTKLLAIRTPNPDATAARLRRADPPVIARIESDYLLIDPRTVLPRQHEDLLTTLKIVNS